MFMSKKKAAVIFVAVFCCSCFLVTNNLLMRLRKSQPISAASITTSPTYEDNNHTANGLLLSGSKTTTTPTATKRATFLKMCRDPPPNLKGPLNVNIQGPPIGEIIANNPAVKPGGFFQPSDCASIHSRIAIIVPYRDREAHLRTFLSHMHPILQRQQLNYVIVVVEQAGNDTFNKGGLMNAGYKETVKLADQVDPDERIECIVFHDVDYLPENDRGICACRDKPIHFSEYASAFGYETYKLVDMLFAASVAMSRRHFEMVNGYSNYWIGWGGEDEDMAARLKHTNIPVLRAEKEFYRYTAITHPRDRLNQPNDTLKSVLLRTMTRRMHKDGLNSLRYKMIKTTFLPLYTHILVELDVGRELNDFLLSIRHG